MKQSHQLLLLMIIKMYSSDNEANEYFHGHVDESDESDSD